MKAKINKMAAVRAIAKGLGEAVTYNLVAAKLNDRGISLAESNIRKAMKQVQNGQVVQEGRRAKFGKDKKQPKFDVVSAVVALRKVLGVISKAEAHRLIKVL